MEKQFTGHKKHITWYTNPNRLAADVNADLTSETVILLEGRVPFLVQQTLYVR